MSLAAFISHSSRDSELAGQLTAAIESCFEVRHDQLLCTSVPGHALPSGVPIAGTLLEALKTAEVVVGLITPNSINDAWPLTELGAAWALGKVPIPVLAGGLTYTTLPGPLTGTKALKMDVSADLHQLMDDIGKRTGWVSKPGAARQAAIENLLKVGNDRWQQAFPTERLLTREQIFQPQQKLRWADIEEGHPETLWIWGWANRNVITASTRTVFNRIVLAGTRLNLLTLDPVAVGKSGALDFGPVCDRHEQSIADDIDHGIEALRTFVRTLPPSHRTTVTLRATNWIMAWSGVAIDPDKRDGLLQIEFYHYQNPYGPKADHLAQRPNLILRKESPFFAGFWKSLDAMWSAARPIDLNP